MQAKTIVLWFGTRGPQVRILLPRHKTSLPLLSAAGGFVFYGATKACITEHLKNQKLKPTQQVNGFFSKSFPGGDHKWAPAIELSLPEVPGKASPEA
jgi:hypothetical protein